MDDLNQMEQWIASQKTRIRSALVVTMNEVGGLVSDELIQRLNTPYPPASVTGEDPHRRTGQLSAGVYWNTNEFDFGVVTNVVSSREGGDPNVPFYLDDPEHLNRTYMIRTKDEWEEKAPNIIREILFRELS